MHTYRRDTGEKSTFKQLLNMWVSKLYPEQWAYMFVEKFAAAAFAQNYRNLQQQQHETSSTRVSAASAADAFYSRSHNRVSP